MTVHALSAPSLVDRIKTTLVGLRMPRALEIVDVIVRQLERGETTALEAIDSLLMEELTLRETRRVKTALVMARLSTLKTLSGFDFSFQPSLDRGRIMALAELKFIDRSEAVHFVGPPGTGKSHLSRDSWVGQRNGHAFAVKVADGGVNGVVEFDDVSEGLVGQLIRLQIVPDDLDVVQFRGVFWQPFDREPVCASGQGGA